MYIKPFFIILSLFIFMSCTSAKHEEEHEMESDHHHTGSEIHFDVEKASEFGIEFETVTPGKFNDVIKTSGSIEASASDIRTVVARRNGVVTLANEIVDGARVAEGQKIAIISPDGMQGGDTNRAAEANLKAAKAEYERLKPLYDDNLITASAFREAERSYREAEALAGKGTPSGSLQVVAPCQGEIVNLAVHNGEYVEAGETLAVIAKNSSRILKADLPLKDMAHFAEISSANFAPEASSEIISLKDLNGSRITGSSVARSQNGYVPIYFSFSGNDISAPGGYATVYLICAERNDVLSVPRSALLEIQGDKYLYVALDEDEYEKRLVKTGASDGKRVEILEGVKQGEKIVSKGASIIRMAEVSSIAPPSHTHNH